MSIKQFRWFEQGRLQATKVRNVSRLGSQICILLECPTPYISKSWSSVVNSNDLLPSGEMKLPGGEHAVVEIAKLRDYCLSPSHPRGRHKARIFAAVLGLTQADAEFLRQELLYAARESSAIRGGADEFGERYIVDFKSARNDRGAALRMDH